MTPALVCRHSQYSIFSDNLSLEKTIRGFFNIAIRKTWFSNGSHFRWPTAIKNGGTSLYRAQFVEKQSFPTNC
jgi:hypothetical protein